MALEWLYLWQIADQIGVTDRVLCSWFNRIHRPQVTEQVCTWFRSLAREPTAGSMAGSEGSARVGRGRPTIKEVMIRYRESTYVVEISHSRRCLVGDIIHQFVEDRGPLSRLTPATINLVFRGQIVPRNLSFRRWATENEFDTSLHRFVVRTAGDSDSDS